MNENDWKKRERNIENERITFKPTEMAATRPIITALTERLTTRRKE